jgi:hypothetical protein
VKKTLLWLQIAVLAVSGICARAEAGSTEADARKSPVLRAMIEELDRSKKQLQLQDLQRPFYIEYRIDDAAEWSAAANYGAVSSEREAHQRVLRVVVRVGDYKADSKFGRGDGEVQLAALDDDIPALRYALWSATDAAYKAALRAYAEKQAALKRFETPPTASDFAEEPALISIAPLERVEIDRDAWKKCVAELSGLFTSDKEVAAFSSDIQYSNASVRASAVNRYLVNSEGTIVRKAITDYTVGVSAGTQAADGLHLDRSYSMSATTAAGLDDEKTLEEKTIGLLKTLRDLRKAPMVGEEYHGPVLFSGDASADVIRDLMLPNVVAAKPDMGTAARTRGTYASSFEGFVLPKFMSVIDDPTMATFDGRGLTGAYQVDDEGVKAQAVPLVEDGKLTNYLIGREPVKDFPASNGHGRAAISQAATPSGGVLMVKSSEPKTPAELEQKLLAMAKDGGRDVVYEVETMGPRLTPRLLYRVDVKTGKRELVRGADIDELDQRSLRSDIVAAGDDSFVTNYPGVVPVTVISPSLLFGDITIKRANDEQQKLPYYPPPA